MMAAARVVKLRGELPRRVGVGALTPREREVLRLYVTLGRNKLIAYELSISEQTVKNVVSSILRKLDVDAMGQAAVLFDRADRDRPTTWPEVERRTWQRRRGERRGMDRRREHP